MSLRTVTGNVGVWAHEMLQNQHPRSSTTRWNSLWWPPAEFQPLGQAKVSQAEGPGDSEREWWKEGLILGLSGGMFCMKLASTSSHVRRGAIHGG